MLRDTENAFAQLTPSMDEVSFSCPADAFMDGLSRHIGQPINKDGEYVIGAKVVLGKQWANTIYISTIRTPERYRGSIFRPLEPLKDTEEKGLPVLLWMK